MYSRKVAHSLLLLYSAGGSHGFSFSERQHPYSLSALSSLPRTLNSYAGASASSIPVPSLASTVPFGAPFLPSLSTAWNSALHRQSITSSALDSAVPPVGNGILHPAVSEIYPSSAYRASDSRYDAQPAAPLPASAATDASVSLLRQHSFLPPLPSLPASLYSSPLLTESEPSVGLPSDYRFPLPLGGASSAVAALPFSEITSRMSTVGTSVNDLSTASSAFTAPSVIAESSLWQSSLMSLGNMYSQNSALAVSSELSVADHNNESRNDGSLWRPY
jgi:hypothetical protein